MSRNDIISHDSKEYWRTKFGLILKTLFDIYNVRDETFSEYSEKSLNHAITDSAVRKWFAGQRLPHKSSLQVIINFFRAIDATQTDCKKEECVYAAIENYFSTQNLREFYQIKHDSKDVGEFIEDILQYCILHAKVNINIDTVMQTYSPTGQTKAVVFDFDGTLTYGKTNCTTWESIWTFLGYSVEQCRDLQLRFVHGEFSHDTWCHLTEEKFVAKHLHKADVENIAKKIKLIPGVKETFAILERKNIKIYIVSGSIFDVIKKVLGSSVHYFIDGIKANHFFYDDSGTLLKIVGTKYDFEGKADFLREIATELQIATQDILFVGNSFNDRFAYKSGAKTLCINPKDTDPTDFTVWNECISTCTNLKEILRFVHFK